MCAYLPSPPIAIVDQIVIIHVSHYEATDSNYYVAWVYSTVTVVISIVILS